MKFDISVERIFPHTPEKVWRALTDAQALGQWLMETDFEPEPGTAFKMWCDDGDGGTDVYHCRLLSFEPPRRMVWSWVLQGREEDGETIVEFRIEAIDSGTRVVVTHSGDREPDMIERFKGGWAVKLDQLESVLASLA